MTAVGIETESQCAAVHVATAASVASEHLCLCITLHARTGAAVLCG
jgi:hypothetical protein